MALLLYALGFLVLLVLTQDIHIFPGAFFSKLNFFGQSKNRIPPDVQSVFIESVPGTEIEVWRHEAQQQGELSDYVAIVCHGNGGTLHNFLFVQMWLAEMGIVSYGFDYRGYGRSKGWPSEKGIYEDSDAVWRYMLEREGLEAKQVIVVGVSIGSAPAARLAARHDPKLLLLSSAFTDLKSIVRAQPILGLLAPFVWYQLPTIEHIAELKTCHLILAHGQKDTTVPPQHSDHLAESYRGSGRSMKFISESTGHNGVFFDLHQELRVACQRILLKK